MSVATVQKVGTGCSTCAPRRRYDPSRQFAEALVLLNESAEWLDSQAENAWDLVRRGLLKAYIHEDKKTLGDAIALLEELKDPPEEVKKALEILRGIQEKYETYEAPEKAKA